MTVVRIPDPDGAEQITVVRTPDPDGGELLHPGQQLAAQRRAPAGRVPEAFVAWLWEHHQTPGPLLTQDGGRVQVVYPGRRSGSWGPDFHGALLAIDNDLVRGDVEVHVHARDWHVHGHSSDPAYGNTVLHVVMGEEAALPAVRFDGAVVPTVAIGPAIGEPGALLARFLAAEQPSQPIPCRTPEEAAAVLERAGLARFAGKVARFEGDFACVDPPQALWTGVFEALGYSANVRPFRRLANRVPLIEARSLAANGGLELLAVLLGEAGLLPHQRGQLALDDYAAELEQAWHATGRYGPLVPLGWRIVGVRPGNTPVRRVAAVSALLIADREEPLHKRVLGVLAELPPNHAPKALRSLLLCAGDPYWQSHADIGRALRRPMSPVGPGRAADIAVNVLLPWAAALANHSGDAALASTAEAVYLRHPPLAANEITRHMAAQIVGPGARAAIITACRQQGLIHVYRGWCDARDCATCPAGGVSGWGSGVRG